MSVLRLSQIRASRFTVSLQSLCANTVKFYTALLRCYFYIGTSFIADHTGQVVQQADRQSTSILVADFDLDVIRRERRGWGLFRDRRPDLYGNILTKDGSTK